MRRALFCLALIWLGTWPASAGELPNHPLTLRETLELLRSRSPLLASARARVNAVAANEITARLRPNPVFTSANQDFNVFSPGNFDIQGSQEFTDSLLQTIERGHKRQRRVESARLATRVVQDNYRDTERQLELALRAGFVGLLLAKSNLALARDNRRDYQETVRLNEVRLKAGEISQTELDRIKLEQARFETGLLKSAARMCQSTRDTQTAWPAYLPARGY